MLLTSKLWFVNILEHMNEPTKALFIRARSERLVMC